MRWGIVSTAKIAGQYFVPLAESGEQVIAVSSRNIERAKEWASDKVPAISKVFDSSDELIGHPDVEVVYLPVPTGVRTPLVIQALQAGKHVLIEKPVSVTAQEASNILSVAKKHNLLVLDGTMWIHHERTKLISEYLLQKQVIGTILHITCTLTSPLQNPSSNIRANKELEPHGCLGDLGWYCIRWILFLMNNRLPIEVTGHYTLGKGENVPFSFNGLCIFDKGESASFFCSFRGGRRQNILVSATDGQLSFENFVTRNNESQFTLNKANEAPQVIKSPHCDQMSKLVSAFVELTKDPSPNKYTHFSHSIDAMKVLDALLQSAERHSPVSLS